MTTTNESSKPYRNVRSILIVLLSSLGFGCAVSKPAVVNQAATAKAMAEMRQQGVAVFAQGNVLLQQTVGGADLLREESQTLSLIWAADVQQYLLSQGLSVNSVRIPTLWEPREHFKSIDLRDSSSAKSQRLLEQPYYLNSKISADPILKQSLADASCLSEAAFEQYAGFTFRCTATLNDNEKKTLQKYAGGSRYLLITKVNAVEQSTTNKTIAVVVGLLGNLGIGLLEKSVTTGSAFGYSSLEQIFHQKPDDASKDATAKPSIDDVALLASVSPQAFHGYTQAGQASLLDINTGKVIWTGSTWNSQNMSPGHLPCRGKMPRFERTNTVFRSLFCP